MTRMLIAGVGNPLFGDDGFGGEVVRCLAGRLGDRVLVRDFGIRSFDFAHALMDGPAQAILVDAMSRGGAPGTLYLIEPSLEEDSKAAERSELQTHGLDPARVLRMVQANTGRLPRLRVLGCEPGSVEPMSMGLSDAVQAAIEPACQMLEALVRQDAEA